MKQATGEMYQEAHRYARRRAAAVARRIGARVDQLYARELVNDALADTWLGADVTWEPEVCSLLEHVRALIRSRSTKDVRAARQRPHVSMDDEGDIEAEVSEALGQPAQPEIAPTALASIAASVIAALRLPSSRDPAAIAILDAWEAGVVDREEVVRYTALSATDHKAARERLRYRVRSLPQGLVKAARSLLGDTA